MTAGTAAVPVLLELVVGRQIGDGRRPLSLAEADAVTALGQAVGVTGLRLVDAATGAQTLDPTVVGSYLAGRHGDIGYLADVPTTHQAPYNVARRVLSADRATEGRFGVTLRTGGGDEVSDATAPDPTATDPAGRWAEYADVLVRLWESFPRRALIGDVDRALVVDDTLIRPIRHEGRFYRVAGPLDGPSSVQGRPVLAAADLGVLDLGTAARSIDVAIVDQAHTAGVDAAVTAALRQAGRDRTAVALIGRLTVPVDESPSATAVRDWLDAAGLDGVVLAPAGGAQQVTDLLRSLVPRLHPARGATLRAGLGLPDLAQEEAA